MENVIIQQVNNSWWHETIRLYCAQTDASRIISACLDIPAVLTLLLAVECISEAREVEPKVREKFDAVIRESMDDPQRQQLIGEAILSSRLR